jgi:multidrug efflux pump subunit AcrB
MLTGTLVTVAGFIPIGLNNSAAGEYTFTLFVVIAVSLLVSWIVAVLFAPLLGVTHAAGDDEESITRRKAASPRFSAPAALAVRHHWLTIIVTVLCLSLIVGMASSSSSSSRRPTGRS